MENIIIPSALIGILSDLSDIGITATSHGGLKAVAVGEGDEVTFRLEFEHLLVEGVARLYTEEEGFTFHHDVVRAWLRPTETRWFEGDLLVYWADPNPPEEAIPSWRVMELMRLPHSYEEGMDVDNCACGAEVTYHTGSTERCAPCAFWCGGACS